MSEPVKVSIVIPTFNEQDNITLLLGMIEQASTMHDPPFEYEAIVVDDGNDRTAALAAGMGARVRRGCGQGLGRAILDGIAESQHPIIVVMDADLSHNPHSIPRLIRPIVEQGYEMVIGSRYIEHGSCGDWGIMRKFVSRVACWPARVMFQVRDGTSGFFAVRRSLVEAQH